MHCQRTSFDLSKLNSGVGSDFLVFRDRRVYP